MSPRDPSSIPVDRVAETGSTNTDLLAWARELAGSGTPPGARLLVAERQTAGRGRRGRPWHATPGASLTFSLAWPMNGTDLSGLSLAVGVAIADAIDADPGDALRIGLKWPNDLWLVGPGEPGRKLGGVLIETTPLDDGRLVVIGVGLNVLPQAVADAASGVASIQEIVPSAQGTTVLGCVVPALAAALALFEREGFGAFMAGFEARDLLRGQMVTCGGEAGPNLDGTAMGVSPSGALRLRTPRGGIELVGSGEVTVRPVRAPALRGGTGGAGMPC